MFTLTDPKKQTALERYFQLLMSAANHNLSTSGTAEQVVTQSVDALAALPPDYQADVTLMVIQSYEGMFSGQFVFLIPGEQALQMADILMGGVDPGGDDQAQLEMQIGAVGEAINQVMGEVSNKLKTENAIELNLFSPQVQLYDAAVLTQASASLAKDPLVTVVYPLAFNAETTVQLMQVFTQTEIDEFAELMANMTSERQTEDQPKAKPAETTGGKGINQDDIDALMNSLSDGMAGSVGTSTPKNPASASGGQANPVTVQPVEFMPFDSEINLSGEQNKNLNLLMDISLNLSVELGKAILPIKEVLELTRGSVIELDRIAGEPVDLLANGKLIAKGEVVVIEDNFGLRVTSILSPSERLQGL